MIRQALACAALVGFAAAAAPVHAQAPGTPAPASAAGPATAPASAAAGNTQSSSNGTRTPDTLSEGPFVEHRLALQLSDATPAKQALVLSVANQMLKRYGIDKIAIDVVAFGPGIVMLRSDSTNRAAVDSLVTAGVRFDICMNTVQTVERETGKPVPINPRVHQVPAAVARILYLTEHGYTLVRP